MEQISDGQQETAAIVIYEAFVQRMGGPWDGKDSSMAAQLCWASAGEIFRRIQLPPALTAARIEGERAGLERAARWHEQSAYTDKPMTEDGKRAFLVAANRHLEAAKTIRALAKELPQTQTLSVASS